ncbi:MAG: hypothetical protein M1829_001548 [Trizodia sp. TS-e1964]|nr:MAG: hypothetical protein M1829_001548 [Trizodia sp. TS-e1964]
MAGLLNSLFGAQKPGGAPIPAADDGDFVDFAGPPDPLPTPLLSDPTITVQSTFPTTTSFAVPYTKWYRVWERTSPSDFVQEAWMIAFLLIMIIVHKWGTRRNRQLAKKWFGFLSPLLEREFALVGFGGIKPPTADHVQSMGLPNAVSSEDLVIPEELFKERNPQLFISYATGRQNIASADVALTLYKRFNPFIHFGELLSSFLLESMPAPVQRLQISLHPFDGQEAQLVPTEDGKQSQDQRAKAASSYDSFVWAIVNKDDMKRLRDERYDVSLTTTKDNSKLPDWATIMTESAEVTDLLLSAELIEVIEKAGEVFEYLIVTDQPIDKPLKLDDAIPKKRLQLSLRVTTSNELDSLAPLISYFLRLPDQLASSAKFRPEVMRKVRQTREDEIRKLQKADQDERAEERSVKRGQDKKDKRESLLKNMSAEEQRKYLEKEREKDLRKSQKRITKKA